MAKRYEVVGHRKVYEHARGERFFADLKPELEAILIQAGHLTIICERPEKKRHVELTTGDQEQEQNG